MNGENELESKGKNLLPQRRLWLLVIAVASSCELILVALIYNDLSIKLIILFFIKLTNKIKPMNVRHFSKAMAIAISHSFSNTKFSSQVDKDVHLLVHIFM